MENPCRKDCPRRSPVCHSSCPDYDEYREFLERKKAMIKKNNVYNDYITCRKYNRTTVKLRRKK
jgi:hypothetical protein